MVIIISNYTSANNSCERKECEDGSLLSSMPYCDEKEDKNKTYEVIQIVEKEKEKENVDEDERVGVATRAVSDIYFNNFQRPSGSNDTPSDHFEYYNESVKREDVSEEVRSPYVSWFHNASDYHNNSQTAYGLSGFQNDTEYYSQFTIRGYQEIKREERLQREKDKREYKELLKKREIEKKLVENKKINATIVKIEEKKVEKKLVENKKIDAAIVKTEEKKCLPPTLSSKALPSVLCNAEGCLIPAEQPATDQNPSLRKIPSTGKSQINRHSTKVPSGASSNSVKKATMTLLMAGANLVTSAPVPIQTGHVSNTLDSAPLKNFNPSIDNQSPSRELPRQPETLANKPISRKIESILQGDTPDWDVLSGQKQRKKRTSNFKKVMNFFRPNVMHVLDDLNNIPKQHSVERRSVAAKTSNANNVNCRCDCKVDTVLGLIQNITNKCSQEKEKIHKECRMDVSGLNSKYIATNLEKVKCETRQDVEQSMKFKHFAYQKKNEVCNAHIEKHPQAVKLHADCVNALGNLTIVSKSKVDKIKANADAKLAKEQNECAINLENNKNKCQLKQEEISASCKATVTLEQEKLASCESRSKALSSALASSEATSTAVSVGGGCIITLVALALFARCCGCTSSTLKNVCCFACRVCGRQEAIDSDSKEEQSESLSPAVLNYMDDTIKLQIIDDLKGQLIARANDENLTVEMIQGVEKFYKILKDHNHKTNQVDTHESHRESRL